MFRNNLVVLVLIILIALFIRVYQLDKIPVELFGDEIDVGLQAYSILTTGKDYFGNGFPLMLQSFTENRLPVFIYSAVPFIATFGLNEWGVRLTGVFWGILGIFGIYLLSKKLFSEKIGLIAAFVLTITPWHIQYSRQGGIEAEAMLTILTFATWTFLKGLEKFKYLIFSAILFAISFYIYATSALFIVLFGLSLLLIYHKKILVFPIKKLILVLLVALVVLIPFFSLIISGKATERSSKVSILTHNDLLDEIVRRRNDENNSLLSRVFHNKFFTFSERIGYSYFYSFSHKFLFFQGDPVLRHSADMGVLYFFQFFLITLGIVYLIIKREKPYLLIAWLLVSPISSSLTIDGEFHASRLIFMLIPLTILSSLGINYLLENLKATKFKLITAIIFYFMVINIFGYFHRYYNDWKRDSWRFWQAGYKEAMIYLAENDQNFSRVYLNSTYEPSLPRFLFWNKYDMNKFQKTFDFKSSDVTPEFKGYKLDNKYYFGQLIDVNKYKGLDVLLKKGEAYMVSNTDEANLSDWRINPPGNIKVLKTITNPFGTPIFYIVTKI